MSRATKYKYIAIGVNLFVILLSISILVSLYLFSDDNSSENIGQVYNDQQPQPKPTNETSHKKANKLFFYLPSTAQDFINWLGQSVLSHKSYNSKNSSFVSTVSLFTAGRPLIIACLLSYLLAIVSSIAIGLEHVTLLVILIIIFGFIFASSLVTLVFIILGSVLKHQLVWFSFSHILLLLIISISTLEVSICC